MLKIGDIVYTICHFVNSNNPNYRKIYYSKKEVVGINRSDDGQVIYTAGKHRELRFAEAEDGSYVSIKKNGKPVFLTEDEARVEKHKQIEEWNKKRTESEEA